MNNQEDISNSLQKEYDQYIQDSINFQNYISDLLFSDIDFKNSDLISYLETNDNLKIFNILLSVSHVASWNFTKFNQIEKMLDYIIPIIQNKGLISNEQIKYEIFPRCPLRSKIMSLLSSSSIISDENNHKENDDRINNKKLFEIIKNDDFVTFQDIISQFNINLEDSIIIPSNFEYKSFFVYDVESSNFDKKDDVEKDNDAETEFFNYKYPQNENRFAYRGKFIEIASFFGSINVFKFLWMNKAEVNDSITRYAIAGGNFEIIYLIEDSISFTEDDLYVAVQFHRNEICDYLINNYDFQLRENDITAAVKYNNLEILVDNIDKLDFANINKINTLLMICIHNKNAMIFIILFIHLLKANTIQDDTNFYQKLNLYSILKEAITNKSFEIVKFLIKFQEEIKESYTFIDEISANDLIKGTSEIMAFLIPYINPEKFKLDSELMCKASSNSVVEVVKYIDSQCNFFEGVEFADNETSMNCACLAGNFSVVKYFADTHKDWINQKDNNGLLPIHNAVISSKINIVKFLILDLNNDVNAADDRNRTPLYYAVDGKCHDIVAFLCSLSNIDINVETVNGITPLELAINNNDLETVNILKKKGGKNNIWSNI